MAHEDAMQLFMDTTDLEEIKTWARTGLVDGVTTNPTLIAQSGYRREDILNAICQEIAGPVSAEVLATDTEGMLKEAHMLYEIAPHIVIKLPLTVDGLKACVLLSRRGISTNVTLCFSAPQALLAAKAGATYVSPFVGRLDDTGADGMALIQDIRRIYQNYPRLTTKVLVASVRHLGHVLESARLGADVLTLPPKILHQMFHHPLTEQGLATFLKDAGVSP